jgi:arylsulfatase A-like enzyme
MRIIYFDIDSLRPDHLGCYGYHRATSPNIDRIAGQGMRAENYYVSDAPCLPSRTAMWSGRFGIHNGLINHGGTASEIFADGIDRGFRSTIGQTNWMKCLRDKGIKTATISPFGERHSAFHWYAGFNEIFNTGKGGLERADEVAPIAIDWLKRNARAENWFLHVNLWDPHTPYRTPESFGNPFEDEPLPSWYTEAVRAAHWSGIGPHSAREVGGFGIADYDRSLAEKNPNGWPSCVASMHDARMMFDGYDRGVRFADEHIGRILNTLADQRVLAETAIVITADHGENLGELNIYGDHQTADYCTSRVPLIVAWPGIKPMPVAHALHYHVDFAATVIELVDGAVPRNWDGRSFATALKSQSDAGRDWLVLSQGAWSCQRAVRFEDWLCIKSYHDGYHGFPEIMLFNVNADPHEQANVAECNPQIVGRALQMLDDWHEQIMRTVKQDPMETVLHEGGAFHTRGQLPAYLARLRETGRAHWADRLASQHPRECT